MGRDVKLLFYLQAPAVDVVAVSLPDLYAIALHNLKADETLFTLKCEERLTSLAFRLDNFPILVGGSENGSIFMWDLESECLFLQHHFRLEDES